MSDIIVAVNASGYATPINTPAEPLMDASGWFEIETMTLTVEPGSDVSLNWFAADGWRVISAVKEEDLKDVVTRVEAFGYPEEKLSNQNQPYDGGNWAEGDTGRVEAISGKTITTIEDGKDDSTWIYTLERRKLQSERVMASIAASYQVAITNGKNANEARYAQLLALFSATSSATEASASAIIADKTILDDLVQDSIAVLQGLDFTGVEIADSFGDGMLSEINTSFDNQLSVARAALVSRGMYNSTITVSMVSGIELLRQRALDEARDRIAQTRISAREREFVLLADAQSKIQSSLLQIAQSSTSQNISLLQVRNAVLSDMLKAMADREDEYPSFSDFSKAIGDVVGS
jgi:hypothetical protein